MKRKSRKAACLLGILGLVLSAGVSAGSAMAYFTTYTSAGGRAQLQLGFTDTETNDDVRDWTKHISILNTGEQDCYVRVKIFAGEKYLEYLEYTAAEPESWRLEDGYWYYEKILSPGETTGELLAALERSRVESEMEEEEFNVIVIQEHTPVLYDGEGNPYADWSMTAGGDEM